MDYTMVGGTVNLASRLEHEAPPGGVLISFETYAHVKDDVRCEEHGPVRVKGITHTVATYEVVGPKPQSEQPRLICGSKSTPRVCPTKSARVAADALRRALGLPEKDAPDHR